MTVTVTIQARALHLYFAISLSLRMFGFVSGTSCFAVVQGSCFRHFSRQQVSCRQYTELFGKGESIKNNDDMSTIDSKSGDDELLRNYNHPAFSPSFQAYVSSATQSREFHIGEEEEGVRCTGEPSTDPSRDVQNIGGLDSEWLEDAVYKTFRTQDDSNA
eukprot:CAMPEP_0196815392 /NCGR_PEP_ID=MMETSP1362-20130617/49492_1 /TAXON_ID=163516 /ORGANISM="Leptocylindrus danicus, Strain CCMP1856" /LENGTH=159 /DNA_ID=CAMNT_0042192321 /DNA_START=26 /DNA_END=505 /DNA_ORIENTATION=-